MQSVRDGADSTYITLTNTNCCSELLFKIEERKIEPTLLYFRCRRISRLFVHYNINGLTDPHHLHLIIETIHPDGYSNI